MTNLEIVRELRVMAQKERDTWGKNHRTDFLNIAADRMEVLVQEDIMEAVAKVPVMPRRIKGA